VEALSKEKEKDNVLTYLELLNLKSASLLDFEEFGRRTIEAKKKNGWWTQIRNIIGIYSNCWHSWKLQVNQVRVWT
jgi:hypothetical protein